MEKRQIFGTASLTGFEAMNPRFTRAKCRIMFSGRNRNRTDVTQGALDKFITRRGYENVPVVAHLYKDEDGKWRVGGHDSKMVWNSDGSLEIIDETVPFGVIPENCDPRFEEVVEPSGEVKRYFTVDIILWTHRYNIMDAAKSDVIYFNQSMEIELTDCYCDDDGYCVIRDFDMSALCLLNHDPYNKENEVEPCFPSSAVAKFDLDKMKDNFNALFEELKEFNKGVDKLNYSEICEKLGNEYFALGVSAETVAAVRKEDFSVFEIPYKADEKTGEVVFDYEGKQYRYLAISETDGGMASTAYKKYTEAMCADAAAAGEKTAMEKLQAEKTSVVCEMTEKLNAALAERDAIKADYEKAKKALDEYIAAEQQAKADARKAKIDEIIDSYENQLGGNAEYRMYRVDVDYSKSDKQVNDDMLIILGKASRAGNANGKLAFSAATWGTAPVKPEKTGGGRYGTLFDNID